MTYLFILSGTIFLLIIVGVSSGAKPRGVNSEATWKLVYLISGFLFIVSSLVLIANFLTK